MKPNYTPQHLLLFTGIDVKCQGASTWSLHGQTRKLSPALMETLIEDQAIDWVKPLLLPLSEMTQEQIIHIAKLALDIRHNTDLTNETHFSFNRADGGIKINAHYYDTLLESYSDGIVTIEEDFYISHSCYNLAPHNQPEIFQYLIQNQFDIFNWIQDGTALDKSQIK